MKKKDIQIISVIFICISGVLSIIDGKMSVYSLSFFSLLIGTIGSILAIFVPNKYVYKFNLDAWTENNGEYIITISGQKHRIGKNPTVNIFKYDEKRNSYEKVLCGCTIDNKGNIKIHANDKFIGMINIT